MKKIIISLFFIFETLLMFSQSKNDTLCCNNTDSLGRKIGKWIEYNLFEGDSLKSLYYYEKDVLEGKAITYYPNGKVEAIYNYKNGKHHGKIKYFYKTGSLQDIFYYENGEFVLHLKFTPTGEIFQESNGDKMIQYKKGKQIN